MQTIKQILEEINNQYKNLDELKLLISKKLKEKKLLKTTDNYKKITINEYQDMLIFHIFINNKKQKSGVLLSTEDIQNENIPLIKEIFQKIGFDVYRIIYHGSAGDLFFTVETNKATKWEKQ